MSSLITKVLQLAKTPSMMGVYSNWLFHKEILGKDPEVLCAGESKVSGWINFSEYWSFHQGIPQHEIELMKNCLPDNIDEVSVAIDIGANIGMFALALANLGYTEVHAFEPIEETFTRLQQNIARSKFQTCIKSQKIAVGNQAGYVNFQVTGNSPATNRILTEIDQVNLTQVDTQTVKIPLITLDEYCESAKISRIHLLKIDVEGMEKFVLQGAKHLLQNRKIDNILIEICPENLAAVGYDIQGLYELFTEFKYAPYSIKDDGTKERPLSLADLQSIILDNILLNPSLSLI
jgi:FkbM family methyltransferase